MKKKIAVVTLILSLMLTFVAFASLEEGDWEQYTDINYESELLPSGVNSSYGSSNKGARGDYIAVATVGLGNEGNGKMAVISSTSSHTYCDRIRMKIYLDKYNESKDTWENIKTFTYDVKSSDVGGNLHLLNEEEIVTVQKGYYYRVRGVHTVYQNGKSENFSTYSKGVLAE
ncbi:MAG: DUF6147 family protein [bacterium]|nr:DUF6147 family protein [bacterium]